ncbi:F-box domain-containing protein [Mycena sanguinolenta]|uniref:F-box domain-containing protein n=1 Tax=Mycena sanguinolenta TaxID=230812 RepID=A0A8H6Y812_9AGAR|nr:F-box domain-containing protein [Mycena sanguinolenta]
MPFEALGEDVLLKIFCFCDISTVLAVSAINKALRRIALSKQLWLSLVLDPRFRDALDLPPPDREKLECLSTEELIALVKNALVGPGSLWDSAHDVTCSATLTSIRIPFNYMEDRSGARLLPGARYIFLRSMTQNRLCIYDVWSARCIWEHLAQVYTMCEVDLVPGCAIARVFFVRTEDPNALTLHVEEVDLTTGASHEVFDFSLDSIVSGVMPWVIMGDFLLATVLYSRFTDAVLVLINWRASTFVSLSRTDFFHVKLIPGYILSMYQDTSPPHGHILVATALEAFSDHWQSLTDDGAGLAAQLKAVFPSTIRINGLNITTQERLEYSGRPMRSGLVCVTSDPLCAGAYNISVYAFQFPEPPRRVRLMERIGNRILGMAGAARGTEAPSVLAQAVLCYQFTPAVSAAGEGCSLRLVSARRVLHQKQGHCPRAILPLSKGNWIDVVYREGKCTGAGRCTCATIHPFVGSILLRL